MSFLNGLFGASKKRLSPDKIYAEYPLGIRYNLLLRFDDKTGRVDYKKDIEPYHREANRIETIMVDRNVKGVEFEKAGRNDEAIALYEQNVADRADTSHPYERLRINYTKRKQYDDAIRVCKAYVEMSGQLADAVIQVLGDRKLAKQLGETGEFLHWIKKSEQKKEGETA